MAETETATPSSPLQTVDDDARALARRLIRGARHAALATLGPGDGWPAVSLALVASDFVGRPLLLVSGLSPHTEALAEDARCSLLFGTPGKGDPLAHPRLTLRASATVLSPADPGREAMRARFLARHPKAELYVDFPDFRFVRLEPAGASLNGGFGKAYALSRDDLVDAAVPDLEATAIRAIDHMNADHRDAVDQIAAKTGLAGEGWRIASADRFGFEIARGDQLERIVFGADAAAIGYRKAFVALVT